MTRAARPLAEHLSRFGLVLVAAALAIGFSIALPDTFPTSLTWRGILDDQAVIALLALGLTMVVAVGEFDLSVGYLVGLLHILAVGLIVKQGLPWLAVVVIVVAVGLLVGLVNGLLVQVVQIDSFIATLGTGTIAYAAANWYSQGQQVTGALPHGFTSIYSGSLLGIPNVAWYVAALTLVVWLLLEYTPTGRYLYALGSNRRAAELAGIPTGRYVIGTFVVAGGITGLTGVVLASRLQLGDVSTGPDYLLPVFVGAMLGSTTIRQGRSNPLGTIVAVATLGIGIAGLQQLGGSYFVLPLFNGSTLIIGVGLAAFAGRRARRGRPGLSAAREPVADPGSSREGPAPVGSTQNGARRTPHLALSETNDQGGDGHEG